jgi:hypothetical protein
MLDFTTEQPIPLATVCSLYPGRNPGRHPGRKDQLSFSTVWRWVLRGVRGADGEVVRLEAARVGGRWFTSREALARFTDYLTPRFDNVASPAPRTPRQADRAARQSGERLRKQNA